MVTLPLAVPQCSLFVFWFCFLYGLMHLKQKEEDFAVYEPYCANYTNASDVMLMEERSLVVRLIFNPLSAQESIE